MRVPSLRVSALLLCGFLALPVFSEPTTESFAVTLAKSAGTSVASAGGVAIAKALTGAFYEATCAQEASKDWAEQYFCNALAGFSGRDEQEWKRKVEKQLTEIKSSLDVLEKGQARLQFDLNQQHKEMYRLFKQAAAEQIATNNEAEFETLWKEYMRQFDDDLADVNREAMLKLAKKILGKKLDDKLGLYNTVLTTPFRGNQALLRYPFYDFKEKNEFRAPFFPDKSFDPVYEGAERAFVDSRARQEKVYAMVLWAIKVLESDCQMRKPAPCEAPAITSKEFKKAFDAYTKDQVIAFNEGLDWVLFTYGDARGNAWFLPDRAEEFLTRANILSAALLGNGEGAWGTAIGMGKWDGKINVQCGAISGTIAPRFSYLVPVAGRFGEREIDWWVSRAANTVYDEVHFSKDWKVFHYYLPDAKVGSCTVSDTLPGKGMIPWIQPGTQVMRVRTSDNKEITFGSFIAIQRAGGTYAMASGGKWQRRNEPFNDDAGTKANVKNARYDWAIETNGRFPQAAVLYEGRGEYNVLQGGRVRKFNQIYLYNDKQIFFPEDRQLKLGLVQGGDCAKTCRGSFNSETFILDYDVANGAPGTLKAVAAVFLHPTTANPNDKLTDLQTRASGHGVYIDGSYGSTKDRQVKNVAGMVVGSLTVEPNTPYYLQYAIEFDLSTEGPGVDATQFMVRGKLTPAFLYVAK